MCNCVNVCRTWEEIENGKYPASNHAPCCEDYKTIEFRRITYDGATCIMTIDNASDIEKDAMSYDKAESVFLTQDQFDKLDEFMGW